MSDVRQIVPEQFHQPLVSARVPVAMPQAGEVLLRVDMTVICGSDNHTWRGESPGGFRWSWVMKAWVQSNSWGPTWTGTVGDTSAQGGSGLLAPLRPCHRCYYCTVPSDFSSCEARATYGEVGRMTWNSYAERVLLSDGMAFCRTPDDTPSLPVIAFGCAMPTVLQATDRLGGFQRLDIVVIQGSGPAGLAATAVANLGGVDCVIVIDRFPERLALARRRGVRRRS